MKNILFALALGLSPAGATEPRAAETNAPSLPPAAAAARGSASGPIDPAARNIRFQFDGMPYRDALERFAQMANKPLLAETNLEGTLTFNDPRPYTYSEALDTLNLVLSMKRAMLVESDHYLRLVPFQELTRLPFKVFHGLEQAGNVSPGQIVTVVLNLKNLEASETAQSIAPMLSDAGSIAPLTRGRGLIVTDRMANIKRVQDLLSQIDSDTLVDRQMRTHTLLHASGVVLADILNKTFGLATAPSRTVFNQAMKKYEVLPADPSDYVTAVFDEPSRTLVIYGPRDRVGLAEDLIKKFEDQDGSKAGEVRIFSPRWTRAEELVRMLRQAIPSVAATNEPPNTAATKARLIVDNTSNRVIATAPISSQLEEIEKLIREIDQPISGTNSPAANPMVQGTKVFRLDHADTASVEKILTEALAGPQAHRNPLGPTAAVSTDPATRSVVVTGSGNELQRAADIIAQLDQNPALDEQTRFLSIGNAAEVNRLLPMINQIYQNEISSLPKQKRAVAKILPDPDSGRLIITGTPDHLKRIQAIVTLLRGNSIPGKNRQLHVKTLEFTKVDAVLKSITDLVNERLRDDTFEGLKPLLLTDPANNRLLATATDEQWKQIEEIIAAVDVAPAGARPELHLLEVKTKPAQEIIPVLAQLLAQTRDPKRLAPDPKLTPDPNGRQIIALCLAEDFERIQKLLAQLDGKTEGKSLRQLRSIQANNRNLTEVVGLLEKVYKEQLAGKPEPDGGAATFIPDAKSNRIMVSGASEEIARAESILREVDPPGAAAEETRVIRLESALAGDLSGLVDKAVNNPRESVKVLVDAHSNSIVLTGQSKAIEIATHIVHQLDTKASLQPRELRILELKVANASEIAPMVTQVFTEMTRDARGPNYVSDAKIIPGGSENRLLVTGNADDLDLIQKLVEKIDQPSSSSEDARVFQLKKAKAVDLAPLLATAMRSRDPRRRYIPRVSVAADLTSNSLIVSGPKADVDEAGLVIQQLDREAQRNAPTIHFLNLNTADPSRLATLAVQLFKTQHADEAGINEITITPEPSLKRLILLAPEPLIASLEKLISDLDQSAPENLAKLHLIDLQGQSPSQILPLLSRVYLEEARTHDPSPATLFPDESGARIAVIGTDQQARDVERLLATLNANTAARGPRQTRIFEVGTPEEVQRIQPLLDQLYRDQLKGKESSDPPDAQILPDTTNGRLIVTARTNHLNQIAILLDQLKANAANAAQQQSRVFDLETASAPELATTVRALFLEELKHQPGAGPSNALILPDVGANRLIVSGTTAELDRIERIIRTLDTVNAQAAGTRIFPLKHTQAAQLAAILSNAFVEINRYGRTIARVSVAADPESNSLIVSGQPKDIQSAATIIEQLDAKGAREPRQMRIISVKSGAASDLAVRLRQLYLDRIKGDPNARGTAPLLMNDEGGNRLIIAASESQLKIIQEMVDQLQEGAAGAGRQLHVFLLKKNSASAIATMVAQLFAHDLQAMDGSPRAAVSASPDDHTLVVDANGPLLERIDQLVHMLDAEQNTAGFEVRTYHLPQGNAAELAPTLGRLFQEANRNRNREGEPRFEADASSSTVIVAAYQSDFAQIEDLMKKLQNSAEVTQEIRTFKLAHGDATQVAGVLESMLTDNALTGPARYYRARWRNFSGAEEVRVVAAPSLNSVIVQGPPPKLALASQIIESLDKATTDHLAAIRTVQLRKAQAEAIADAINQTLAGRQRGNEPPRVSVTPVAGSNSVLVNGPEEEVQQVLKMIQELDNESAETGNEVRIYKLEHSDARDVSRIAGQFLQSIQRGRFRSQPTVLPTVSFDERSNALIVSGAAVHFKLIEQLLASLDHAPEHPDRDVQFVALENTQAEEVALRINSIYEDLPKKEQPVITSDPFSNSITVIARKADSQEILSLIKRLDSSAADNNVQVRMVPLDRIPAEQMAKMLKNLYSQMSAKEIRIVDRLPPAQKRNAAVPPPANPESKPAQTNAPPNSAAAPSETRANAPVAVLIAVEKDSNSLILSGPARELDRLERMVSDLSFSFISSDAEFRQFRLKEADPVMVAKTLTELFRPESIRVESPQPQSPQGQAPPQRAEIRTVMPAPKIAIVAEPRTRSVIARAKPADFVLLESLIKQLDAEGIGTQLQFRILPLTHAEPAKVLPLITQMITQLTTVRPGEAISASSAPFRHAIFLVGRDVMLDQVQHLVESLDTPAAVGETQILLVPLRKANATQLAILLNQMLQPGKNGETSPEARELQEQVRRLKVQNSDGKSVVLDLQKPIQIIAEPGRDPQSASRRLIVSSTPDNLAAIAALVDMMDSLPILEGISVKVIPLAHAQAVDLLKVLNDLFAANALPQFRREDRPVISMDERTNAIILAGDEKSFALIAGVIERLDGEVSLDLRNIRILQLENADSTSLAANLQRILDERIQQKAGISKAQADALRVIIIDDPRTNSLLVGGSQDGFDLVKALVQELDKPGPPLSGRIRLIPLKNANAGTIGQVLISFFTQRYQNAKNPDLQRDRPIIIPDLRSNSLLVSAGVEDNRALDELLKKLDRKPENPAVNLTVISLRHNDSAKVAVMVEKLFTARLRSMSVPGQRPMPQDQVDIEPDPLTNSLVISASPENLELVRSLIEKVDVEPAAVGGLIEIFTLQYADAQRASTMLRSLVDQGLYRPGMLSSGQAKSPREALAITVDPRSNSLIVSASPENLLIVQQLIKQIDSKEFEMSGDIQLFPLKNALASHVATVLEQFFRSKRAGEAAAQAGSRTIPVTVTADERTNTLLVTGGKETFAAVTRIIQQLDAAEVVAKTNFKVFPLKNATAGKLQAMLQELFARRPSRMTGQPPEPITIVSDAWANAIIVGASDDDLTMVSSLIEKLDSATPQPGIEVRVFPLAKGDARRVAQTVQSLYREGTMGATAPVAINVDERLNALVISAGETDVQRIAELIKKLDTDTVARVAEIRVIELKHAQADELAMILTRALTSKPPALTEQSPNSQLLLQFISMNPDGKKLVASALKEGVLITPDRRTNTLIVSAPADSMHLLEQLIAKLDSESPQVAQIKVFNLQNADARQMAEVLTALFHLQPTGAAANYRSVQYSLTATNAAAPGVLDTNATETVTATVGSAAQATLTVSVDPRTNSLIVSGSDHYVELATKIIQDLDASPAQERISEVYRLRNSRAERIEAAVKSFLDQERQRIQQVLGPAAVGTAQRVLDREIAIVAETLSNTLLVSANPRYFPQIRRLIEELDQPQAQVLIQVLLAEVILDKNNELGVEWNAISKGNPSSRTGTDLGVANDLRNFGGFSSAVTGSNFNFILRALESEGRLEVLSRPQILTADNQEATINVGQRIPFITSAQVTPQGGSFNQFLYQDVGVQLSVTPRINPDGFVKMDVATTNSELSSSDVEVSPGIRAPTINERRATTTVSVQSGQTIIIGGLISTTDDTRVKRVPFLGKIPLLGALFRSAKALSNRKELLIILTPQVLVKSEDVGQTSTAREMTEEQLRGTSLTDQLKRDSLQKKILDPIFGDIKTNAPLPNPERKSPPKLPPK